MTTCPRIYTVRVHPVSKMVRAMPTETQNEKAQPANPIIALQQETIVLTACMRSKDVREDVLPMLLEDDFVKSDHRTLFRAIRAMHEADYPIDEVSLLDYLKSGRKLDAAGERRPSCACLSPICPCCPGRPHMTGSSMPRGAGRSSWP